MMEASPLPRAQSAANHSVRVSQSEVDQQAEQGNFEQQLTNQLEQAKSSVDTKNSNNNQQFEESTEKAGSDSPIPLESADALLVIEGKHPVAEAAIDIDSVELPPNILFSTTEIEDVIHPGLSQHDQTMPYVGNTLPPVDGSLPVIEDQIQSQPPLSAFVVQGTSRFTQNADNTPPPHRVDDPAKSMLVSARSSVVEGQQVDEGGSFQEMEIATASNSKQDGQLQNNHSRSGISIASSVAAAASQLHQVPVTTASANLNFSLPSFPVDSILSAGITPASSGISSSVHSQAWSQGLTEQVSWMMRGGIQSAEIRLNPANLGPLEVKLSIEDDVARVSFVSSHAVVREALDAAMPRLREMLEQQGISLADVDISQYSEQGQQFAGEADEGAGGQLNHITSATEQSDQGDDIQGVSEISVLDGLSIYA